MCGVCGNMSTGCTHSRRSRGGRDRRRRGRACRDCMTRRRCAPGARAASAVSALGWKPARGGSATTTSARTPSPTSAGSTWRTSPARNVQLSMPLARAFRTRVGHRGRGHLDAVDAAAAAREQEADRAGAGIEVDDGLGRRSCGGLGHQREQPLGLHRVGLEERVGRHLEAQAAERFGDVVAAERAGAPRSRRRRSAFLALTFSTTLAVAGTRLRGPRPPGPASRRRAPRPRC